MIAIIVDHVAVVGQESAGLGLIRANGTAMRMMPGFRARHTFVARDDKRSISTVTLWNAEADYQRWLASPEKKRIARPPGELWVIPPVPRLFDEIAES
jgi:heme-degrading monooxygenase HmoA